MARCTRRRSPAIFDVVISSVGAIERGEGQGITHGTRPPPPSTPPPPSSSSQPPRPPRPVASNKLSRSPLCPHRHRLSSHLPLFCSSLHRSIFSFSSPILLSSASSSSTFSSCLARSDSLPPPLFSILPLLLLLLPASCPASLSPCVRTYLRNAVVRARRWRFGTQSTTTTRFSSRSIVVRPKISLARANRDREYNASGALSFRRRRRRRSSPSSTPLLLLLLLPRRVCVCA